MATDTPKPPTSKRQQTSNDGREKLYTESTPHTTKEAATQQDLGEAGGIKTHNHVKEKSHNTCRAGIAGLL